MKYALKRGRLTSILFFAGLTLFQSDFAQAKQRCTMSHLPTQSASATEVRQEFKRLLPIFAAMTNSPIDSLNTSTRVYDLGGVGAIFLENNYRKVGLPTFGGFTPDLMADSTCPSPTLGCLARNIVIARKISLTCSSITY